MFGYTLIKTKTLERKNKLLEENIKRIIELSKCNRENIKWKCYWKNRYMRLKNKKLDSRLDNLELLKKKISKLKSNGVKQKNIAEKLDINPSYISLIMTGRYKPREANIKLLLNKI